MTLFQAIAAYVRGELEVIFLTQWWLTQELDELESGGISKFSYEKQTKTEAGKMKQFFFAKLMYKERNFKLECLQFISL